MDLVKFVKVTEENKDEMARELGYVNESELLKDAEFETLVGKWIDADEDMKIEGVSGTLTYVDVVRFESRGSKYTLLYTSKVALLIIEPGVGVMSIERYKQIFC